MAADPEDPIPPPGVPSDWADQERILAEEMAAFPAQDEPDCEALEYLEYFDDGDAGGEGPWLADLPGAAPGDHPGSAPAEHPAAAPDSA